MKALCSECHASNITCTVNEKTGEAVCERCKK